jgi:hypothetical protein
MAKHDNSYGKINDNYHMLRLTVVLAILYMLEILP